MKHTEKKENSRLLERYITARELGTILAALRYWQNDMMEELTEAEREHRDPSIISPAHFFGSITPLNGSEIDELCEKLNFGSTYKRKR